MFPYPPLSLSNKDQWGVFAGTRSFSSLECICYFPYDQSQVENWFVEGFTEYMSKLTSYRTGFISGPEFLQQLAFSHDNYLNKAGKISLMEAGKQKGSNYSLIYDGGFTVALALDIDVRKLTNNKKGIIDIMNIMYSKFGKNKLPYKYEDIIKVSSEIAGTDLSGFFNAYISGVQVIPINKYLADAGLEVSGQNGSTVIQPNMNASPGEKNLLKAMLSK